MTKSKREAYDNLVVKGINRIDKSIATLLKDVDNDSISFLLACRILNGVTAMQREEYVNNKLKDRLGEKLKEWGLADDITIDMEKIDED